MSGFTFCPRCASRLEVRDGRATCPDAACGFIHYDNPVPVAAAIVERPDGVVLVRSRGWPEKMFGLPTGFVEPKEDAATAVLREVKEELDLDATLVGLVGVHGFPQQNQLLVTYHLKAEGAIRLSEELIEYRVIPIHKVRPWPFGTGLALAEWLSRRGSGLGG